jgi:hypothetical protein
MKRLVLLLALLMTPGLVGKARAQMPAGPAFVMEARVGGGFGITGNGGGGASAAMAFGVRLIDRLQIGLGFTVFHGSSFNIGNGNFTSANTTFTLNPQLTVDILKAKDNKVAWYGKVGIPVGAQNVSTSGPGAPNQSTTVAVVGFDVGLGVRYCPHPNVAFGIEGGFNGFYTDPGGNGGTNITGIYGSVVGTFYWGKGT